MSPTPIPPSEPHRAAGPDGARDTQAAGRATDPGAAGEAGDVLHEFGPGLFVAEGPVVSFYGFPYPTRMAACVLPDGGVWVWSPIAFGRPSGRPPGDPTGDGPPDPRDVALADAVAALGPVRHIVAPNKIHHLFLRAWTERWPEARCYAPPGLAARKPEIDFDAELGDTPEPAWAETLDQVVFRGSLFMEEVVFFHRPSRTAILCDLVQRHEARGQSGWRGALMRLDGLVGEHGSTPREWRASFLRRAPARIAREKVRAWRAERLLIAHGTCATTGADALLARALRWI